MPRSRLLLAVSAALVACGGDLTLPETGSGGGPPAGPDASLTAGDDRYSTTEGSAALTIAAPGVLANDLVDGAASAQLRAAAVEGPEHGRLELRADGSLDYVPDDDWYGSDRFTYRAALGEAQSAPAEVVIEVQAVNDAPQFVPGPDQEAERRGDELVVDGWASGIVPGPDNESGQQVSFLVDVVSGEKVLKGVPEISPSGTLTYRPDHEGTAQVEVRLRDDGGTANGGTDTGPPHILTITVSR